MNIITQPATPNLTTIASLVPQVTVSNAPTAGGMNTLRTMQAGGTSNGVGVIAPQMGHKIAANDVQSIMAANTMNLPNNFTVTIYNSGNTSVQANLFNTDVLTPQAANCLYTYPSAFGSAIVSRMLATQRAGIGCLVYRVDLQAFLTVSGQTSADSVGASNANFLWNDANLFNGFTPTNIPSSNISRSDFSDNTFTFRFVKNVSRFTQAQVTLAAGGSISLIFYTNPS